MSPTKPRRPILETEPASPVTGHDPSPASSTGPGRFGTRFATAYVALAVLAGAAVGVFVVLLAREDPPPPAPWSASAPSGSAAKRLRWIAHSVSARYRFPDGAPLAQAVATRPHLPQEVQNPASQLPLALIIERPNFATGEREDFANQFYPPETNAQFTICGLGENCAFPKEAGPATTDRFQVLQRMALELALYTLRYVGEIDTVTVFMPPRPGAEVGSGTTALLRRTDLEKFVSQPLARTLGPKVPSIGEIPARERFVLEELTNPRFFTYAFRQAQDNSFLLILNPLANTVP